MAFQTEGNMPHYFLCNCQSNTKKILAKCHENIPSLSQGMEKNNENLPCPPPLQKKQKNPQKTNSK